MASRIYTVNMGEGRPSLLTVGYTLKLKDGSTYRARTTSGVLELGTATGIYGANIDLPEDFVGMIEWDSGESNPVYASEDIVLGTTEYKVVDDVRTLLRAQLNQLVDFVNSKFKEIPKPEGGVKELTKEVREMKERLFKHLEEDEETDVEWEQGYLDPILEKVDETNRILSEKHEQIVKHVNERVSSVVIPNHAEKLEEISSQMLELQKDTLTARGDVHAFRMEAQKILAAIKDELRNEVLGVPSKISIPNHEERLNALEKKLGDGINYLIKAGEQEFKDARQDFADATDVIKGLIRELSEALGSEASNMTNSISSKLSDAVRNLLEMMNELHPDTLEKRRLAREQNQNKLNFIMGVKK